MDLDTVRHHLTGPLFSVRVPFNEDGSIDYDGMRRFIDAGIEGGSRSVILTAGNSHYTCLADEEIARVTRVTCEHAGGRAMVVAADCEYATDRAIEFAHYTRGLGADIYMCKPPNGPGSCTPESLAEHYAAVARVMPVMVVTNVFAGMDPAYGLETLELTLERSDHVLAIKDDLGGAFVQRMCMMFHERCAIFAGGRKHSHMNAMPFGCDGYMSVFVTFRPELARRYWRAVEALDLETARSILHEYDVPLFNYCMGLRASWNGAMHGMLELYGIAGRWRRKPYVSMNDREMAELAAFLRGKKLLDGARE